MVIISVRLRINRNPVRKQKIMAREVDIAPRTMSHIIQQDWGLGAFKRQTGERVNIALKENRNKIKMPVIVVW